MNVYFHPVSLARSHYRGVQKSENEGTAWRYREICRVAERSSSMLISDSNLLGNHPNCAEITQLVGEPRSLFVLVADSHYS